MSQRELADEPGSSFGAPVERSAMSPSSPFILRPVATALLMVAIVLAGLVGFKFLPLSALPQVDYPTIQVQTLYPGASPDVMAQTVTAPLERQFGQMAGLSRMSSTSAAGVSIVTLQFGLGLTLDVAEQEVQAAINAGGSLLPADLPAPPVYAKVTPADAPVLTLAITSETMPLTEVQNIVNTRLALKISQVNGVGLVSLSGGQRPAVRIQADTRALASYGLALDSLRSAITAANANGAKGNIDGPTRAYSINSNDQLLTASDYSKLVIAYHNGAPVRVSDVAQVIDSAENTKLGAWASIECAATASPSAPADNKCIGSPGRRLVPAIILNVQRQPGANVIATVDAIKARLPELQSGLPSTMRVDVLSDRTTGIRASVLHVEIELLLAVLMVVLVIFAFLRNLRATVIASLAVPISLIGTCGAMYLLGLQPEQPEPDGADHCHRFRGRRRHCDAGKHLALHRARRTAHAGRAQGCQADRFHHHFAHRVADCSADSPALHGRCRGASVSRIRHHAGHHHFDLGSGVPHAGAHDVGALAQAPPRRGRQPNRGAAAAFF